MLLLRIFCLFALSCLTPLSVSVADEEAAVRELEEKCAHAREERIKPLRDAEILKCKTEQHKDPEYCERFWRDYGDATRLPNGRMSPRLFHDLPECLAAEKRRRELK